MTKDQTETPNVSISQDSEVAIVRKTERRERSSIQFPYGDLDDAVRVASAINSNAGTACTVDQLAAYVNQPMTSGTFRLRLSGAKIFGLIERLRGNVRLTDLGRSVVQPDQEAEARVEAFLHVPLYAAICEKYLGHMLPPSAALEQEMAALGVSSKQTDKARRAFMRSARQAGFFSRGDGRLVMPTNASGPGTKPIDHASELAAIDIVGEHGTEAVGDKSVRHLHPFIEGLLATLPAPDEEWRITDRVKWLQTAAGIFSLIYEGDGNISIQQENKS